MKIAILAPVAWHIPPKKYGPWEQVASSLADGLATRGVDVTLFATKSARTKAKLLATIPGPYYETEGWEGRVAEDLHFSFCFQHAHEFDVIHNHVNCYPLAFTPFVKTPVVTTLHSSVLQEPWTKPFYLQFKHLPYVSISDAEREALPELNYVATVYHGLDLTQFTYKDDPGSYLVALGRISPQKGTHLAIAIAKRAGLPLKIAALIAPNDQDYFNSQVRPHLGSTIEFIGEVGPRDRDRLLGNALALLHPTTIPEPFGLTLIEAQATGTPVIGFGKGSVAELVRHGETGFVVHDVPEAVEAVRRLKTIDRRQCRKWIEEHFTIESMVDGYLRVYEKVLAQK